MSLLGYTFPWVCSGAAYSAEPLILPMDNKFPVAEIVTPKSTKTNS